MRMSDRPGVRRSSWLRGSALIVLLTLALIGCGGGGGSNPLIEDVLLLDATWQERLEPAVASGTLTEQAAHERRAEALRITLQRHHATNADGLKQVLDALLEGEERLAAGSATGAEAEALRQRHADYWVHLRQRELPPDYR